MPASERYKYDSRADFRQLRLSVTAIFRSHVRRALWHDSGKMAASEQKSVEKKTSHDFQQTAHTLARCDGYVRPCIVTLSDWGELGEVYKDEYVAVGNKAPGIPQDTFAIMLTGSITISKDSPTPIIFR